MNAPGSIARGPVARIAERLSFLLRPEAILFVVVWLACGALTNRSELAIYDLHAASIEAVADHGTFQLGHSDDRHLKRAGGYDAFRFHKRGTRGNPRYSARQPGLSVTGAIPYSAMRALGLSFQSHYDLCMAVVAWTTSGLFTAIGATLLFALMKNWGTPPCAALFLAFGYALGTNVLPFSGVPHHDVQATALLIAALWSCDHARRRKSGTWSALTGLLFGLALFFSLLPTVLVAVLLVRTGLSLPLRHGVLAALGFFAGLSPTLAYNWHYFGDPLLTASRAGNYHDTWFSLSWPRTLRQLNNYLGAGWISVAYYEPQVYLGFLGLFLLRGRPWQDRMFLPLGVVALLFFLCNLPTLGHAQFGPRYLMALMPLATLGLSTFFRIEGGSRWPAFLRAAVIAAVLYAIAVNVIGGVGTCCYSYIKEFAPAHFLKNAGEIARDAFPLAGVCAMLLLLWIALLAFIRLSKPRGDLPFLSRSL